MADLREIREEYHALGEKLTDPELFSHWEQFQELSKRRNFLEKILKKQEELEQIKIKLEENKQLLTIKEDLELSSLAQEELSDLLRQQEKLKQELEQLLNKDENLPSALILEIRPGAGGEEAALFARNLLDMYRKFALQKGWKVTLLELKETDLQGIKEASLEIAGDDAFQLLQYEGGVHRVQRIPATEKSGRVHTSTASVVILPKPKPEEVALETKDLEIEFTASSGPGGQNVNKRQTAVRIRHIPTEIVVHSQISRSQQQNREFAIALLRAKILQTQKEQEQEKLSQTRKSQIGKSQRAEKIRTYNFPQDRITDHRFQKSWHGIEKIMTGELNPIVQTLQEHQESHSQES